MSDTAVTISKATPKSNEVMLFDPKYEGFVYGQGDRGDVIAFGSRGGFAPSIWIGPKDHPLLDGLLKARPELVEGDGQTHVSKVLVCPECFREFNAMIAYRSHVRTHQIVDDSEE